MLTLVGAAVLLLLLSVPSGTAVPVSSFYSYGSAAGDSVLPRSDDGSSPAITLPTPFWFYGANYTTIFVNNNGDLSFGLAWSVFSPTVFPIPNYPLVAPYQADVDTRGNGSVWYRSTQDTRLLAKAANDLQPLTGATISPQWLFIATWDHVGYFSMGTDKTNTFQCILVTDNVKSYAIFLYANGLIQWPSSGAQVGFNAGDNINYVNVPGSQTPNILNITQMSNVGIGGQWVFQINQFQSCGVLHNYSENSLLLNGFVKCYDQPYSSHTTSSDLNACNGSQFVFVGAKNSISTTTFAVGAFGLSNIFAVTNLTTTAYYDPGRGAYWYRYPSYSFGFASSSSVTLNVCDVGSTDCASRLCWHLDINDGGWRAGCTTGLNGDPTWRKVMYKGNFAPACFQDVDECALGISGCTQICTNTIGSYVCSCYPGYEISSDHTCVDVDECTMGISGCNQICTNTIGSYVCSCYLGYQISSNNKTCVDIDECALGISGCNQICNNTIGSYMCSCYPGYQISSDHSTCVDVDECALGISRCNQICTNTNGSYICSCYPGYQFSSDHSICVDIDECALGISGCNQICTNTIGSYMCSCYSGYQISSDHSSCVDVDECALGISGCTQICTNTIGSYVCSCYLGYQLSSNNKTCVDIDECALGISGCNQICTNTIGSYVCSCFLGYHISANNKTCVDIDECSLGISGCNQICTNTIASYMCSCYLGYQLSSNNKTCVDVDECALGISGCNQICTNTIGSYMCSCYLGYQLSSNNKTCVDIDECSLGISGCNQICTNTIGSYVCSCYLGYQLSSNNKTCVDIDECSLDISGCNPICTNTIGSYMCSCYPGYQISSNNKTCVDIDECALGIGGCNQICTNINGSYVCSCSPGYQISSDHSTCVVATKCEMAPNITTQPQSISASMNSPVTLICQVTGCPGSQITWYKDNVIVWRGPYLVIPALTLSDRGFYRCTAVNEYGYASSSEARVSIQGVYQYSAILELNISATSDIASKLNEYLIERSVLNSSLNIILAEISYSGSTINALITLAGNYSFSYNTFITELYNLLSMALTTVQTKVYSFQRFDGCPLISLCANQYVWPDSDIGTTYTLSPCVQRHCGGTYSTGGQWEPVVITCATDYVTCAVDELDRLKDEALNNTEVAKKLLTGIDDLLSSSSDAVYQTQGAERLLDILNYYSNNAIVNETTVFTGKTFAAQLEDVNVSSGCFTGKSFSVNLGSVDMAVAGNTAIDISAIGSNSTANTTASVHLLPPYSDGCSNTGSSLYRLTFYTFLKNTLFQSPEQEQKGLKLGSIVISVGGNAVGLAEKLQFSFQVVKDAKNAEPAQWTMSYINSSYQVGMWSTEGCRVISAVNNVFITETELGYKVNARTTTIYQGNFGMLLDLNPGGFNCPAADILTIIGTMVSIVSLLFFIITYLSSKQLRRSEHGQVLINMSSALLCLYIVFLMAAYTTSVPALCGISAALVHYFMLVYFMWTAAEAVFLYMKLVKVLGSKVTWFSLKAGLVSWLVPFGIVIICAGAGYRYYYNPNYCRASGLPFYLGFLLPFLAIYLFNWIVFVIIMVSLCKHSARSTSVKKPNATGGTNYTLRNVLIAAGLALVLGLGWGFGLAASSHSISALACTFQFLFSLFVSCQGLLLLLFHGVRSKDAKKVWRSWLGLSSKSHTVTMSMGGGGTMQSGGQTTLTRTTYSNQEKSLSLEEKSFSESEKPTAIEEKLAIEAALDNSSAVPEQKITIAMEVKEVMPKKAKRNFFSLSLLKKDTPGGMPLFRSDSQCTNSPVKGPDEAILK